MAAQNPPLYLQAGSHPAEDVRRFTNGIFGGRQGIMASGDLTVTQNGTPNMSVLVASGKALINGTEATYQGTYFVENRGSLNVVISAADATNPRKDLIIYKVQDAAYSGGTNSSSIVVVTGTPAASPVAPAIPANSIVLAEVAVAALASSITNANITDKRTTYNSSQYGLAASAGGTVVCTSTTRPASPYEGLRIFETDTDCVYVWNGSVWVLMEVTGAWLPYTPTITGWSIGNGTVTASYHKSGRRVSCHCKVTVGSTTTFASPFTVTAPVLASYEVWGMAGIAVDLSTNLYVPIVIRYVGATGFTGYSLASAAQMNNAGLAGSVPFTWAAGDTIDFLITYESQS